jgi:2-oxo-4-hydroxy-4-carboxy--5-ureidoimidazoline (OHCU) decarboxylase
MPSLQPYPPSSSPPPFSSPPSSRSSPHLSPITTHNGVVRAALSTLATWDDSLKAQFIAAHPRIGERRGLSALSAREQGAGTLEESVLDRLAQLNACYERRYPGLRYVTFVNGRSRAAVAEEMEACLGIGHGEVVDEMRFEPVEVGDVEWKGELERAVVDVGRIAESRLRAMGYE